jgi:hypothetical protein
VITCRKLSDPPPPGTCKLRIRGNGDPSETFVFAVDADGVEREIVGVTAIAWAMRDRSDVTEATITVCESDVELDVEPATIEVARTQSEKLCWWHKFAPIVDGQCTAFARDANGDYVHAKELGRTR